MVKQVRSIVGAALVVLALAGVIQTFKMQPVNAEGPNQFPGLTNGASPGWNFNSRSPDPGLTWLFKANNPNEVVNGQATHILRNRTIGRNIGTKLRLYYGRQPQEVKFRVETAACELEANGNFAGNMRVSLGGQLQYDQPTEGKKIDEVKARYNWVLDPNAGPNQKPYILAYKDDVVDSSDRNDSNSPACENFGTDYPYNQYKEGCNDLNGNGTRCGNNGNENYSKSGFQQTRDVPDDGGTFGNKFAVRNKLDGKTFTLAFPANYTTYSNNTNGPIGFDADVGMFFADIDIELTAAADLVDVVNPTQAQKDIMQRITFNVYGEDVRRVDNNNFMNARMGYRYFNDETFASKYFGLQGNGGRNNTWPEHGQKYAIPFGLNCNDPASSRFGKVILYDPDSNGYGTSYVTVFKRNPDNGNVTKLNGVGPLGDYILGSNTAWDGANDRITINAGSNQNARFEVKMDRGSQYMLTISNPNTGPADPSSNVWSLFLPTDSINGLINCRYYLTPNLTGTESTFTYQTTLTPTGSITNTSDSSATGNHPWRITKAVFASRPADLGRASVVNGLDGETPCDFMQRVSGPYLPGQCGQVGGGTYPADASQTLSDPVGPVSVGTYVCYLTSVYNPTWEPPDDNNWAHSLMQCSVSGAKPKFQVWGYDVKADGLVSTSLSDVNGRRYGSWGEYGVFSDGLNRYMASGNGLLGGVGAGATQDMWSGLTFANADIGGRFGIFNGVVLPQVSQNGATVINGDVTINNQAELNALIGGQTKAVLRVNGTLRINSSLTYPNSVANITDIPRIVLNANDIILGPNVTQLDPWIVAYRPAGLGRLSTCSQAAGGGFAPFNQASLLNSGMCNQQIKFNSPVVADQIFLYRTFDTPDGQPAETFNVRADGFLASYVGGGTDDPVASTDSVLELPPRF